APPLSEGGKSEIWEALGRRFTGMTYKEADELSQVNKDFIKNLFPASEIYLCLLDAKARINIGQVGVQTRPALHMLKSIGFEYANEIDPFDGGPHLHCKRDEVSLIKQSESLAIKCGDVAEGSNHCLVSVGEGKDFKCGLFMCTKDDKKIILSKDALSVLNAKENDLALVMTIGRKNAIN
ncbi:arginine N-succinyltransferase, partial [bacterium]|nr:arginine N-succinyltransferase [bacterium]